MMRFGLIITRACFLVAILASSALWSHYLDPIASDFCGGQSGCEALRRSPVSHLGTEHLSLPLLGLLAYSSLFLFSLWPGKTAAARLSISRWLFILSGTGASIAVGLIAYQALVAKAFCWLCLWVDAAAIAAAFGSYASLRSEMEATSAGPFEGLRRLGWGALLLLSILAPLTWNLVRPEPPVPAELTPFYRPGKINVMEFADFQCPYCRKLHPLLEAAKKEYGDRVNLVRFHMPLGNHPFAEGAARSAICVERLAPNRYEEAVDRLFTLPLSANTPAEIAAFAGIEPAPFKECLRSEETEARLLRDETILRAIGFQGLPTTFVNSERFIGARTLEAWRETFDQAARGSGGFGIPAPLYWLSVLALGILAVVLTRRP